MYLCPVANIMTSLDIIILVVFAGSVILGYYRGVIVQAGAVGGLILATILCRIGASWLAARIAGQDGCPDYFDTVLANVILFIAGYLAVRVVCHFFKKVTHALKLGMIDRLAGAVFSLFQWMMVLSLALNFWLVVSPQTDFAQHSRLGNGKAVGAVVELAPAVLGWAFDSDGCEDGAGDGRVNK